MTDLAFILTAIIFASLGYVLGWHDSERSLKRAARREP